MHPPRFYCPQLQTGVVTLPDVEARHALRSLRLRPGDALTLFDGRGGLAHATLQPPAGDAHAAASGKARKSRGRADILVERIERIPPPGHTLTLITAACKGPRLDWLVEKCTELGVTKLCFAEFARSVVHVGPHHLDKLHRTAVEACKQSGRAWLPEIEVSVELEQALASSAGAALLVAHPAADATPLGAWLRQNVRPAAHLTAVIGPEGGLSPPELGHLRTVNPHFVSLAHDVLRVETAAMAVAASIAALHTCNR